MAISKEVLMADFDYDVLVIGSGAAGLCAALEASNDAELSVLVAESEERVGGASFLSTGIVMGAGTSYQKSVGIADDAEELARDYLSLNGWQVQPAIAKAIAQDSAPTIDWLVEMGVTCKGLVYAGDERVPRGHAFEGMGAGIVEVLHRQVRRRANVDIVLKTKVTGIIRAEGAGEVLGARVGSDEIRARATVIATGGFGSNRDLIREYFPRADAAGDWLWYVGPPSSRGDGLVIAREAGAEITGFDHGVLRLRANFTHENEGAYLPGWMVVVNSQGRRYFDEMSPYNVAEAVTMAQDGPVFAIWDDKTKREAQPGTTAAHRKVNFPDGHPWEDFVEPLIDEMVELGKVVKCDTIPGLAAALGVNADGLQSTIDAYNEDCVTGEDRFFAKEAPTFKPVVAPPFYGTELRLWHMSLTAAGPRIDSHGHVLDSSWRAIPGLYAAGEVTGNVICTHYVGSGNSYANALVFGRRAGQAVLADLAKQ
jgi:succinate dehydrogenase/fumarate reductase flavoprotein subunit